MGREGEGRWLVGKTWAEMPPPPHHHQPLPLICRAPQRRGGNSRIRGLGLRFCRAPQNFLRAGRLCGFCSGGIFHADPHFGGYFVGRGQMRGLLELLLA